MTRALSRGVQGIGVDFVAVPPERAPRQRVVVALDPPPGMSPEALCGSEQRGGEAGAGAGARVAAALCDGAEAVNGVAGGIEGAGLEARERLLWRTGAALFPDDYADTYGFHVLPDWLDVGVGGSFGF